MYDSPEPRRRVEREINFCSSVTPPIRGGFHDKKNILVTKLDNTNQTFTVQLLEKSPVSSGPRMNDDGGSNSKFENVLKEIQSRLSAAERESRATKTDLSATETRLNTTERDLSRTKCFLVEGFSPLVALLPGPSSPTSLVGEEGAGEGEPSPPAPVSPGVPFACPNPRVA